MMNKVIGTKYYREKYLIVKIISQAIYILWLRFLILHLFVKDLERVK